MWLSTNTSFCSIDQTPNQKVYTLIIDFFFLLIFHAKSTKAQTKAIIF